MNGHRLVAYERLVRPIRTQPSDVVGKAAQEGSEYDFGLLSTAVGLVYSYGIGVPVLLWFALRYLGVGEWSIVEAVAVWGYGQFVWIPVAVRSSSSSNSYTFDNASHAAVYHTSSCA